MLDDAARHLSTASAALSLDDRSGAYQLAYDALRKSAASLLEAQELRVTSRGGHIAVQEAITAQFGAVVRDIRSDAITVATRIRDAAARILDQDVLTQWNG
jgi:hypothetical protein